MNKIISSIKTVTVGVTAYNEEKNISRLLESVLMQRGENFEIQKIIIICDGSQDNTANLVRNYCKKYSFIRLIDEKKQQGVSERINQLLSLSKSEIFVLLDADIVLANNKALKEMIKPFSKNNIGLVGGNNIPENSNSLVGKAVITYEKFWSIVRHKINNGVNIHNFPGCMWAARKELIDKIRIPKKLIANDHYIFLKSMELGYDFAFAQKAVSYYKVPNNLKDYYLQSARFITSGQAVINHFQKNTVNYYKINPLTKIMAYLQMMLKEPIFMSLAILMQIVQKIFLLINKNTSVENGLWKQIESSK